MDELVGYVKRSCALVDILRLLSCSIKFLLRRLWSNELNWEILNVWGDLITKKCNIHVHGDDNGVLKATAKFRPIVSVSEY